MKFDKKKEEILKKKFANSLGQWNFKYKEKEWKGRHWRNKRNASY